MNITLALLSESEKKEIRQRFNGRLFRPVARRLNCSSTAVQLVFNGTSKSARIAAALESHIEELMSEASS